MPVSMHDRDKAMQLICRYYQQGKHPKPLFEDDLYRLGFPAKKQVSSVLESLKALGYIFDAADISLTKSGRCYFETRADQKRNFMRKSIFTPIIVSFITALITSELKPLLSQIVKWLASFL